MAMMSGKRALLALLKQEGVEILFGNPGTTELPLMDALAVETGLRYVLGLQEAAVMAMADGYAQASGRLAVANVHVAPGLGNALGMLYDAQKAAAPILLTAGQHDQSFTFSEPILWADLPTIARPFVKWSAEVRRLEDLPRAIHRAAKTALAPPTGPVFLSLPADVLNAEADIELGAPTRVAPRLRGDRAAIETAVQLLAAAQRPVIVAGDAVAQSGAHAEVAQLAELLGAPVYAEGVANTASFPSSHPLFRGGMPRLAPGLRAILQQHDLLFSVGGDLFTLSLPSEVEPMPEGLAIIHLDTDPWELGKNYAAQRGDPRRPQGDTAGTHSAAARAHGQRAASTGADAARCRTHRHRRRAGHAPRQGARRGGQDADPAAGAVAGDGRDAAARHGGGRGGALLRAGLAPVAAQRRSAELLRLARRRHRLGPPRSHRRQAGVAAAAGGGAGRRWQRHVHVPGAVDRRP